ncbi:MAG: DNA replication factor A protein 1 [Amphiamblys sp. WSBS2006]|nr:MAG: DNA replication factor A protein 1 [Amphiamblys sp. WSBS2006]
MKHDVLQGTVDRLKNREKLGLFALNVIGIKDGGEKCKLLLSDTKDQIKCTVGREPTLFFKQRNGEKGCTLVISKYQLVKTSSETEVLNILGIDDVFVPGSVQKKSSQQGQENIENGGVEKCSEEPAAGEGIQAPQKNERFDTSGMVKISDLNPYTKEQCFVARVVRKSGIKHWENQKEQCFVARVVRKSGIKHWENQKGSGKLFDVAVRDETGEIRITGFKEDVDTFHGVLVSGNVYVFSNINVKLTEHRGASGEFSNMYSGVFSKNSNIKTFEGDTRNIPGIGFNFQSIKEIEKANERDMVDVLGVVESVGEVGRIVIKSTMREMEKKEIIIADSSGLSIVVTLWSDAMPFVSENDVGCVVAFKGVRVSNYGGVRLGTVFDMTVIIVNPDLPEAKELRTWYAGPEGRSGRRMSLSSGGSRKRRHEDAGKADILCLLEQTSGVYEVACFLADIRSEKISYQSCPKENCKKKVLEEGVGVYRCEKCNEEYDHCAYRYILNVVLSDHTEQCFVTFFDEEANALLGVSAESLEDMRKSSEDEYKAFLKTKMNQDLSVVVSCKFDEYNGENRWRGVAERSEKLDYASEAKRLLDELLF